jgi:hypothetical protein
MKVARDRDSCLMYKNGKPNNLLRLNDFEIFFKFRAFNYVRLAYDELFDGRDVEEYRVNEKSRYMLLKSEEDEG